MNAYKFNPITKEYEGIQQAQLDPIQTKKQGKNIYLLPINSTFEIPPEKEEGKAIVFENDNWLLKKTKFSSVNHSSHHSRKRSGKHQSHTANDGVEDFGGDVVGIDDADEWHPLAHKRHERKCKASRIREE